MLIIKQEGPTSSNHDAYDARRHGFYLLTEQIPKSKVITAQSDCLLYKSLCDSTKKGLNRRGVGLRLS